MHFIALIHREPDSGYGVSFPDLPGVITVADTLDAAMMQAGEALSFAAEDWEDVAGRAFPEPRTLDALRSDRAILEESKDAVVAAIPFATHGRKAA